MKGKNMPNILKKINEPKDLRECSIDELNTLAEEIRECIIKKVDTVGGHLGPNLGFVEPTIAKPKKFLAGRQP